MASETSYLDRYQKGVTLKASLETFSPEYNPEDDAFSLASLEAALAAALAANTAHSEAKEEWDNAVDDRAALVKEIMPVVTQSLAYVESNTAWKSRFAATKQAADKVRGHTKPPRPAPPTETPPAPGDPGAKKREQGQRSYVEIADFLRQYIARLTKLTGYAPTDPKISLASLGAMRTEFDALNLSVPALSQTLADAIRDRQTAFSTDTGLHFVFKGVKTSVKAQYGQASPQYDQIKGNTW